MDIQIPAVIAKRLMKEGETPAARLVLRHHDVNDFVVTFAIDHRGYRVEGRGKSWRAALSALAKQL